MEKRVLVVEDDPVSAAVIQKLLHDRGWRTELVTDGKQALARQKKQGYRIVIADSACPSVSGLDLCASIRSQSDRYAYLILCLDAKDRELQAAAYQNGVDDVLLKPIALEDLEGRLTVAERFLSLEEGFNRQQQEMARASETLSFMNNNLVHASKRFEELFNGMPAACFTFDERGIVHEWNRQAEALLSIPAQNAYQREIWKILGSSSEGFWCEELVDMMFRGSSLFDVDWVYHHPAGGERYFVCNVFGLRQQGKTLGVISANIDITERKLAEKRVDEQMETINGFARLLEVQKSELIEANTRLERLAVTDGLTGLLNHRGFQERLEGAFLRHKRRDIPLSLILLDVDHFKLYNDTFGHQAGDVVLTRFSEILTTTARREEATARYGGEEFAIILESCSEEESLAAAARFRDAIKNHEWPVKPLTASFGVSTLTHDIDSPKELIRQADSALYASKARGRDCVTHFSECVSDSPRVA